LPITILSAMSIASEGAKREPRSENTDIFSVFRISNRQRRLPIAACIIVGLKNLGERRDGARRQLERLRPLARAAAIEPDCLHASLPRAVNVGERIVADVHDLRGAHARHLDESGEMRASGFAAPAAIAVMWPSNQIAYSAPVQIGIAVADREQPVAAAQPLERRSHVVVELDAIARVKKYFERLVAQAFWKTGRGKLCREGPVPEECHVVAALGNSAATRERIARMVTAVVPCAAAG